MTFDGEHAKFSSPDLERDLVELIKLQNSFGFEPRIMGPSARFPGEDKIGEWLRKANEIVRKYHPKSYTIGIGIPLGTQVSFSWDV